MVLHQYISQEKLFDSTPSGRDKLLRDAFNITDSDLTKVRSCGDDYERTVSGAKLIYDATDDPVGITLVNVAAVVSYDWDAVKSCKKFTKALTRTFGNEKREIYRDKRLKVTNMHLLRKEIGAYFGNLEETVPIWHVGPSSFDWLRSIKLPESLQLDYETSQLLGVIWAAACASNNGSAGKYIQITASSKDTEFYNGFVIDKLKKNFNLDTNLIKINVKPGKNSIPNMPDNTEALRLQIGSRSIYDMLMNINFPIADNKHNIGLPKYLYDDDNGRKNFSYNQRGFFEGTIAAGSVMKFYRKGEATINDEDKEYVENIAALAKTLGFSVSPVKRHSQSESSYNVRIGKAGETTLADLEPINPRHKDLFK